MRGFVSGALFLAALLWHAAPASAVQERSGAEELERLLTFEISELSGWSGGPRETLFLDSAVVHGGRRAGRIVRPSDAADQGFSSFTASLPRTFAGGTLQLRGWLRTEGVVGNAALWLRQDGRDGPVQFDNMAGRNVTGTTEWTPYTITLPLDDRARTIYMGALLSGEGTLWVDDLELTVDGGSPSEAPAFTPVASPVELDTEFDAGSGIRERRLSPAQATHVALLGRVWGFVKYHHPRIRAGEVNWDYELFRVLPSVLDAPHREAAVDAISEWLSGIGEPRPCRPCAEAPRQPHLTPDLDWIRDRALLGEELSATLQRIHERRPASAESHYVGFARNVGNPEFSTEATYGENELPDAGFRLLALFRFWNIIEYWFPYRDLLEGEWGDVLTEFVPRMMQPMTVDEYRLEMIRLSARIDDTHANVWAHLDLQPPRGSAELPILVRFVEGEAVVTGYRDATSGPETGLRIGDVIEQIGEDSIAALITAWRPFYSASNEPTRLRDMARKLTRGEAGPVRISGRRADGAFTVTAERVHLRTLDLSMGRTHDLPGETFQRLSDEVAYLKLSSIRVDDVEDYIRQAAGARVLVVDIRNYPGQFVVFALGGHLVRQRTPFARFTRGDATNPGAFLWTEAVALEDLDPHFPGAVVILVDEVSLSQAEYTAMALRAAPNALVVGSTTAGADGNVSPIPLPGGISSMISGIGVFYPDRTATQQIGIVPDLEVRPTIAGIRAGRDEVLEAAVSHALGREFRLPTR